MSKRNLTKLAQQMDLDEIEDALDEEEKPNGRRHRMEETESKKIERDRKAKCRTLARKAARMARQREEPSL